MSRIITLFAILVITISSVTAADYAVDNVHTNVLWKVEHVGTSYMFGRFNDISGTLAYDGDTLDDVQITIKAASVDSGTEKLDKHLRSADFFDAGQYPVITFASTAIEPIEGGFRVAGDLTLHGVTRSVSVDMAKTGSIEGHEMFGTRVGFLGSFSIKRSDYGITYYIDNGAVGDEVELTVSVEAIQQ